MDLVVLLVAAMTGLLLRRSIKKLLTARFHLFASYVISDCSFFSCMLGCSFVRKSPV